jgi:hypothetical protein
MAGEAVYYALAFLVVIGLLGVALACMCGDLNACHFLRMLGLNPSRNE